MHCNYIPWDINVTLQMNLKSCQYLQKESNLMTPIVCFYFFKPKVLNAINKIRENKKRPDNDSILDYIIKTEASNVDKLLIISITNELVNQNLIENKNTRQGLDSLY